MGKTTVSNKQLGLTIFLNILAGIFVSAFGSFNQGFVVSKQATNRSLALTGVVMSLMLAILMFGLMYILASLAIDSGNLLHYGLATVSFIAAIRCLILTVKLWKKLN